MNTLSAYAVAIASICLLSVCNARAQFRFEDVSEQAHFRAACVEPGEMGAGCVILDYDNDGWEDFYAPGGTAADRLFRNLGNGSFQEVGDSMFHNRFFTGSRSQGASAFDFDNDGLTDLYIDCQLHDILLKNMGDGTFRDVTAHARIARPLGNNESNCSTFGDFDGDGDNDLYVARWVDVVRFIMQTGSGPVGFAHKGFPNQFYVNNGDGTFTDLASQMHVEGDTGCTNIALFFDYDRDGDLDLFVGNDFGMQLYPNIVFKNMLMETGTATFVDVTDSIGMREKLFTMGIEPNDYNRDGQFDFYQTNIGTEVLLKNSNNRFTDVSVEANIPNGRVRHNQDYCTVTWSPVFGDYDNDGWEDGFIVHGFVKVIAPWFTLEQDTSEFMHNLGGVFSDYTDSSGIILDKEARGGAAFDYDHDGFLDLTYGSCTPFTSFAGYDYRLLHNCTPHSGGPLGHSLEMKFIAKRTAKEGIGTTVDVWEHGVVHSRQVSTGGGFTSQASLVQHVGLGSADRADSIVVYWPADKNRHRQIDRYYNIAADQIVTFEEKMDEFSQGLVARAPFAMPTNVVAASTQIEHPMSIYPQPAASSITIEGGPVRSGARYEIYNAVGQRLASGICASIRQTVNISQLASGGYWLRVGSLESSAVLPFIKRQ